MSSLKLMKLGITLTLKKIYIVNAEKLLEKPQNV